MSVFELAGMFELPERTIKVELEYLRKLGVVEKGVKDCMEK